MSNGSGGPGILVGTSAADDLVSRSSGSRIDLVVRSSSWRASTRGEVSATDDDEEDGPAGDKDIRVDFDDFISVVEYTD